MTARNASLWVSGVTGLLATSCFALADKVPAPAALTERSVAVTPPLGDSVANRWTAALPIAAVVLVIAATPLIRRRLVE